MKITLKATNLTLQDGGHEILCYGHILYKKGGVNILVKTKKPSEDLIELEINIKRKRIYLNNLILDTNEITISNEYLEVYISIRK